MITCYLLAIVIVVLYMFVQKKEKKKCLSAAEQDCLSQCITTGKIVDWTLM